MLCYYYPSFWLDRLKFEAVLVRAKIDCFAQAALTIAFLNFCFRGYCCKNVFQTVNIIYSCFTIGVAVEMTEGTCGVVPLIIIFK